MQIGTFGNGFINQELRRIGYHEVLLENPQNFPVIRRIIWIEKERQITENILLIKLNSVIDDVVINRSKVK
ncbi:Uncharacterised protein [Chlamydia trachomatis]|nr:Uncharacterised protein [Chlamydia trachomatis]